MSMARSERLPVGAGMAAVAGGASEPGETPAMDRAVGEQVATAALDDPTRWLALLIREGLMVHWATGPAWARRAG